MKRAAMLSVTAAVLLLLAGVALANGPFDLSWWTVDGGGATFSEGGGYSLGGAAGQSDAGTLSGGDYTLYGGFWAGAEARYPLFLPVVMKGT